MKETTQAPVTKTPDEETATDTSAKALAQRVADHVSRRGIFGTALLGVLVAQACSGTDFKSINGSGRKKGGGSGDNGNDGNDGADSGVDAGGDPGAQNFSDLMKACQADADKLCKDETDPAKIVECLKANQDKLSQECKDGLQTFDKNGGLTPGSGDNGGGSGSLGDGSDADSCFANTTTTVDLNHPEADGALKPTMKFYGRSDSAMIALLFGGSPDVKNIALVSPAGTLIALHAITGADKRADGTFRPIVIDNVWLKDAEVKVLIDTGTDRKVHTEPVAYFTTYGGKPVKDLSQRSVPSEMAGRQSVTQFAETAGSYNVDSSVTYPNDFNLDKVRNLQTAKATSTWVKGAGVLGTVTDIMGNTINIDGGSIIEYQIFCTYVDAGSVFVRTILHIG